jgi:glycosyltransferase involved in cell wall biosynthesis
MNNLIEQKGYDYVISDGVTPHSDIMLLQVHSWANTRYNKNNIFHRFYYKKYQPHKLKHLLFEHKCLQQNRKKIIVVSNVLKRDLIDNFSIDDKQIDIIYPGVDIVEKTSHCTTTNKHFTFGISATFFKRKGGLLFVLALIITRLQGYNFQAIMILRNTSKQRWLKKLLKCFNMDKNIDFLPFQKNMGDFYSRIDCLVMPSVEEAFGLVALESMINKKPCIVSSSSGISEIIEDNHNGFIFNINKYSVLQLVNRMIYVAKNQQVVDQCVENAYKTAIEYSWVKTFKDLTAILEKL